LPRLGRVLYDYVMLVQVAEKPASYNPAQDPDTLLHNVFGLPGFRGAQEAIISAMSSPAMTPSC
jgi:hypothetical protein